MSPVSFVFKRARTAVVYPFIGAAPRFLTDSSFASDENPLQGRLIDDVLKRRLETLEIVIREFVVRHD